MDSMKSQFIGALIRYGLTAIGSYLATHGHISPEQGAYISSSADQIIGIITAAIGIGAGFTHATTTVAVPKNDPVAAKVAADKIAQDATIRGR